MNNASLIDNDRQQDHGDWFERGKKDYRIRAASPLADHPGGSPVTRVKPIQRFLGTLLRSSFRREERYYESSDMT